MKSELSDLYLVCRMRVCMYACNAMKYLCPILSELFLYYYTHSIRTKYAHNTCTKHTRYTRTRYKFDSWCTLGSLFIESAINWRKGIVSRATRGCFREKDVALRRYLKTNPAENLSNSVQLEFEEKVPSLFHPLYDAKT